MIAILRGFAGDDALPICDALVAGGIRAIEVTLDSPDACQSIRALKQRVDDSVAVGAGTVVTTADLELALDAGADFVVSPGVSQPVVRAAVEAGVPSFPGALTPTEVIAAWRAGASAVKLFPAGALGARYLRELRGPLGAVPLVPTGGIDSTNAAAFFAAGAAAVAIGSWLFADRSADAIRARAHDVVDVASKGGAE